MSPIETEVQQIKKQVAQLNKRVSYLEGSSGADEAKVVVGDMVLEKEQQTQSTKTDDSQQTGGSKVGGTILVVIGILLIMTGFGIILGIPLLIWGIIKLNKAVSDEEDSSKSSKIEATEIAEAEPEKRVKQKDITEKPFELSFDIVIQWFSRIGIFALLIGFIFLVYYAISEGWIAPVLQVFSGVLVGLALLVVGYKLSHEKNQSLLSSLLCGGGIAIVYFMTLATYALEYYRQALGMTLFVNSLLLILVAVTSIMFSLWFNKKELVLEAYALSYLNLLFFGTFTSSMMVYALLVGVSALIVTHKKEWYSVGSINIGLLFLLFLFWNLSNTISFEMSALFLTASFTLGLIHIYRCVPKVSYSALVWQYVIIGFLYFVFMFMKISEVFGNYTELFCAVLGITYFLLAMLFYKKSSTGDNLLTDASMYSSLGFLTLSLALFVDAKILTFFFLIEFIILTKLSVKSEKVYFLVTSVILSIIILFRLIVFDLLSTTHILNGSVKLNIFLFIASAITFYWNAYMWKKSEFQDKLNITLSPGFAWIATALLTFIVLVESTTPVFATIVLSFVVIILASLWHLSKHLVYQSYALAVLLFLKLLFYDFFVLEKISQSPTFLSSSFMGALVLIVLFYILVFMYAKISIIPAKLRAILSWLPTSIIVISAFIQITQIVMVTITLAALALILMAVGKKSLQMMYQSLFVAGITVIKFFVVDMESTFLLSTTPSFMESFLASASVVIVTLYGLSYMLTLQTKPTKFSSFVHSFLLWLGSFVFVILSINETSAIYLTLSWVIFAVILFVVGMIINSKHLRIQSLVLFGLVIFKVFLLDLQTLSIEGRIISFIGLGVSLIVISYLYGKYKDKFHELFI